MRGLRGGFTLVEVLLAFLVLMLGIVAVLSLFPVGMKLSQEMVETSTAALVAKNARGCMEAMDLADQIAGASGLNLGFPLPGTAGAFPKYFPGDMASLGNAFKAATDNGTVDPPIVTSIEDNQRMVDSTNPQFSWDARFDVIRGTHRLPPWSYGIPRGWTDEDIRGWIEKYFRMYSVQISVYRKYREVSQGSGTITVENAPIATDVNRKITCLLTLGGEPRDLAVGWYIRIPSERSDWYRVEKIEGRVLTLDREYAGDIGSKSGVIATDRLVGHFTTFLAAFND